MLLPYGKGQTAIVLLAANGACPNVRSRLSTGEMVVNQTHHPSGTERARVDVQHSPERKAREDEGECAESLQIINSNYLNILCA